MPLRLQVVTPEREVEVCDDATLVIAKGVEGDIGIMPGHSPVLIGLALGPLVIQRESGRQEMLIDGGFMEVKNDSVIVLAEYAALPSEFDPEATEAEVAELKQRLQAAVEDEQIQRELARAEARGHMFKQ
ncbi:MAG TPA: ATP synthase F1 subunit epsilon [Actinomycetota bacterium]